VQDDYGCAYLQGVQETVKPTITITGPQEVPIAQTGNQGIVNTIQLTASGNPTGGTYSWTANGNAVSLTDQNSATVIVQGQSAGSATVTVTYTVEQESSSTTQTVTAQYPTSLGAGETTSTVSCENNAYNTQEAHISYNVKDQNGAPIKFPNMPVAENLSMISDGCNIGTPSPTSGSTDSNGDFPGPDDLYMCSVLCLPANANQQPTGSCTTKVSQTWFVNWIQVQQKTITFTCAGPPNVN